MDAAVSNRRTVLQIYRTWILELLRMTGSGHNPVLMITFIITRFKEAKDRNDITYQDLLRKMNDVKTEWENTAGLMDTVAPARNDYTPGKSLDGRVVIT